VKPLRSSAIRFLPAITIAWVFLQLLSLRLGLLNRFFYDTMHADVQGIDYYSLPKAWLNLAAGHSAYDTFGPPAYGAHFTWYLSHPALAVLFGSWLSQLDPTSSYGAFVFLSLGLMAACAWLLAAQSSDPLTRRLIWFGMLGAFPSYWMLFVGNPQAMLVLALGLLFTGFLRISRQQPGEALLLAGLLLSLLTKPVVLLMLPLLLLLRETRKVSSIALGIYAAISAMFEFIPFLNPERTPFDRVLWEMVHPQWVRDNMNIYTNHLTTTSPMKDNSVHWLNLIAQSQTRLLHVDVFSLPVFLDQFLGAHTPDWLYDLPTLAVLALAVLVFRMKHRDHRMHVGLLLLLATSLTFFLAYPTVWEYQYTSVLPVGAMLLLLHERKELPAKLAPWMLASAICTLLPSLYFLMEGSPMTGATLSLVRLDRVVPVTALFGLLVVSMLQIIRKEGKLL
jgi:hypothetical protein